MESITLAWSSAFAAIIAAIALSTKLYFNIKKQKVKSDKDEREEQDRAFVSIETKELFLTIKEEVKRLKEEREEIYHKYLEAIQEVEILKRGKL